MFWATFSGSGYSLLPGTPLNSSLKVGLICPFVVFDHYQIFLGATIVIVQALCLTIFNLSPTQNTCLLSLVIKLVCVLIYTEFDSEEVDLSDALLCYSETIKG